MAYGEGTSFAVPQISGEAALVWAMHQGWNSNQITEQLSRSAVSLIKQDPTYGSRLGRGLINAYEACYGK